MFTNDSGNNNSIMQDPASPSQNISDALQCNIKQQLESYMLFNQLSLIPAALIVIALSFMKKRVKFRRDCCDGRPGIQVPVDFLGEEENRFSYGIAYGAMAIAVTHMFGNSGTGIVFNVYGHPYIKVFQGIVSVICIGTIYLPFFMCLSTDATLLGAAFGFIYTLARGAGLAYISIVMCPVDKESIFIYWPIFANIPAVLCHFVLLIRYAVIFVKDYMDKCYRKKFVCRDLLGVDCNFEVGHHYVSHVKTLLQGAPKTVDQKWYVKGRNFVYTPEPHFKYSVAILSTVIVAAIIIYQLIIAGVGIAGIVVAFKAYVQHNKRYYITTNGQEVYEHLVKFLDVLIVTLLVSIFVSAFFMYFQMYRMLVSHRNHVIKLIKGDRRFLPNSLSDPHIMVGSSLRFAGYQVAYFLWGFLVVAFVLLLLTLLISSAILFLPLVFGDSLNKRISNVAIAFIPTVGMVILVFIVQQILARYVFKDRSMESKVVNIHNRRLFLLVSFFFFFFNILVGLLSCLLRILKGIILGVLFLGRIDRPLIMKGFTFLDSAYIAYIGFLHLQVAHKHPVVRVFSHLLWSGMRRKQQQRLRSTIVDGFEEDNDAATSGRTEFKETNPSRPRVSASALNKWFIAVTVIRNPVLIYNRKGFLKHIVMGIPNSPSLSNENDSPEYKHSQNRRKESSINNQSMNCSESSFTTNSHESKQNQVLTSVPSPRDRNDFNSCSPTLIRQGELAAAITSQSTQDELPKVEVPVNNGLNIPENGETRTYREETKNVTIL